MDCRAVRERLSLYLDGELTTSEIQLIDEHIESCTDCRAELSSLEETVLLVRSLEPLEVPPDLQDKIIDRTMAAANSPIGASTRIPRINWRHAWGRWGRTFSSVAALLVVAVLIGKTVSGPGFSLPTKEVYQAPSASDSADRDAESPAMNEVAEEQTSMFMMKDSSLPEGMEMAAEEMNRDGATAPAVPTERKVIQTAYLSLQIEKLDTAVDLLQGAVRECGGFVQSSNMFRQEYGRGASYTLRIPADRFDDVLSRLEKLGDVQNRGITGQDVTEEYVDVDARRRNLIRQEERLLAILDQAKTVEDILKVEGQLERVRGEIESLTGRLRYLDNQVGLSTIDVELQERPRSVTAVQLPDQKGFGARLARAFTGSVNLLLSYISNMMVWLVSAAPFLFVGAGIGAVVWWAWGYFQRSK